MWILAGVTLGILAIVMLLPYVASTQIVRNRIAQEISSWSGYRVALRATPRIEIWPTFRTVLNDVAFHEWGRPDAPVVLQANRIEIDLSAIAALRGEIAFTRAVLFAPILRVVAKDGAPTLAAPRGGRMVQAITSARSVVDANPAAPDMNAMPSDQLGAVEFIDGRVLAVDGKTETELVSGLTGRASWPALNRAGALTAQASWRGETVSIDVNTSQPLALLGGGNSRLSLSFASSLLSGGYEGLASLSKSGFIDGTVRLSSPALARALEWAGANLSAGASIGPASLVGRVTGDMQRLKIEKTELVLGGSPGAGVLDVSFTGPVPAVSGTLAFNTLDLRSFLLAFTHMPNDGFEDPRGLHSFARELNVDLRLSAANATAGTVPLTDVAATAQIKDGFAAFDISDATAFGGELQAGLRIDRGEKGDEGQVRLLAENVDILPFAKALGLGGPLPRTRGNVSVMLKGPAASWGALRDRATGTVSVRTGPGTIDGINLAAFLKRAQGGDFFPLSDVGGGELPIDAAEVKVSLSNGIARLDTARFVSGPNAIRFTGIIPYVGRGLALSGSIAPKDAVEQDGQSEPTSTFFVGGSWESPYISPILQGTSLEFE